MIIDDNIGNVINKSMSNIRLVFITDEYSLLNTGVTSVLRDLLAQTSHFFDKFSDIKLVSTGTDEYAKVPDGVEHIKLLYSRQSMVGKAWRCPTGFGRKLEVIIKGCNVVHIHGVWMGPQYHAAKLCIKYKIPFIVTSHGMLEPWLWHDKGMMGYWKKILYWKLVAYPLFRKASVIHAITSMERRHLQVLYPDCIMQVIPNAVDVHQIGLEMYPVAPLNPEPIILFLGRIHPVKGIDLLIRAFALSGIPSPWKLIIAGPEEIPKYACRLKQLVEDNNLANRVEFIGPIYGKEKYEWYRRAWVVAVPSYTEVVGMVNLEAGACGTPTITTKQTGLFNWEEGGGLLIEPNKVDLATALKVVCSWPESERRDRGVKSLDLVNRYYSLSIIGRQWVDLYSELAQ